MGNNAASGQPPAGSSGGIFGRLKEIFSKPKDLTTAKTNNGFMGLLTDNSITLKNLLLSAVVVGLEQLLSNEVFECPLNNHKAYGTWFLVAPFFIVFFTNLVILGGLSKLTDRCCVERYRRLGDCWGRALPNTIKACFGPFVWLIASFADTTYYVCREVGQPIDKRNLTNETAIKILEQELADAKATSHMLAWLHFTILIISTAMVMILKRCFLKDGELLEDEYVLEKREALKAMETFRKRTEDLKQDTADPNAVTSESEAGDHDKDKDGTPELIGQKRVEKLFEKSSEKDKVHYLTAYQTFVGLYPRIASGKPWKPWVSYPIVNDPFKKAKEGVERIV